ncbi:MAG: response regulator [Sulfurimonas sp.]|nr:response regulator [Sulfurimonas sp.]
MELKVLLEYTKDLHILYVEDDIELLEATSELLSNYFSTIEKAVDGQEGLDKYLEYFQNNENYYDIVITDINMPNLNGIEMSKKIYAINPIQKIIITSAHNEVKFLSNAIELNIDGFITKPIDNIQLTKVIYKVSQAISNQKFVDSYLEVMENLNLELGERNKELFNKNDKLEKSLRVLDTMVSKKKLTTPARAEKSILSDAELIEAQIHDLIADDLCELKEIHSEIDFTIIKIIQSEDEVSLELIKEIVNKFIKYSSILSFYTFFNELGIAMSKFSKTLSENPLPENQESVKNIFMLLESFMFVLGHWQDDISKSDGTKVNSFDASLISDMYTITNLWTQKEPEDFDEDLDDIFDF